MGFEVNDSFLDIPPAECAKRAEAEGLDGNAIWEMYYQWAVPNQTELLKKEPEKPRAVVCDIDDLLIDDSDKLDPLMGCVIDSLGAYGVEKNGQKYPCVILVTNRTSNQRKALERLLERNDLFYDELWMRPEEEKRSESEFKRNCFLKKIKPNYAVLGVFTGKTSVAEECWQILGLKVLKVSFG